MYSDAFEKAVNHAMLYEVGKFWNVDAPGAKDGTNKRASGYVNDPTDPGGETKYGIAKNANPGIDIATLTWDQAKDIYYNKYWLPSKCDKIDGRIGVLHFDGAVNHGPTQAAKFLQNAVGVTPDGIIGTETINVVDKMYPIDVCSAICDQRAKFYRGIVLVKPAQTKYLKGWLTRIEEMRAYTTDGTRTF